MTNTKYNVALVVILIIAIIGIGLGIGSKEGARGPQGPKGEQGIAGRDGADGRDGKDAPVKLGAVVSSEFIDRATFRGGVRNSGLIATTSEGTAITVSAGEFIAWSDASVVSFRPGLLAAATLTFPASSTLRTVVPNPGDRQSFCIRNATTTAGVTTILAGSTGVNLNVASSSISALGSASLITGEVGCITLIRQPATATTFDIDALLTVFK